MIYTYRNTRRKKNTWLGIYIFRVKNVNITDFPNAVNVERQKITATVSKINNLLKFKIKTN